MRYRPRGRGLGCPLLLALTLVPALVACDTSFAESRPAALAAFEDEHVAVMLGFTQCPDVCPTALRQWQRATRSLSAEELEGFRLVFVTVDPERDTRPVLERYVAFFDPAFAALRAEGDELRELLSALHAYARKVPSSTPGRYSMDHTASVFLLDRDGRLVDELRHGTAPDEIARRLRRVLTGSAAEPLLSAR